MSEERGSRNEGRAVLFCELEGGRESSLRGAARRSAAPFGGPELLPEKNSTPSSFRKKEKRLIDYNPCPCASSPAQIARCRSEGDHACYEVTLIGAWRDSEERADAASMPAALTLRLLPEELSTLSAQVGAWIPPDELFLWWEADWRCEGTLMAMRDLAGRDYSAQMLKTKLIRRGVPREQADQVVARLNAQGWIREAQGATRRAEQGARKGWGPRRIRQDLCAHGYCDEAIREAMKALERESVDFLSACRRLMRKKWGDIGLPSEHRQRQKMLAALFRAGYDMETIGKAVRDEED